MGEIIILFNTKVQNKKELYEKSPIFAQNLKVKYDM